MQSSNLVVIPLYNEENTAAPVITALRQWYSGDILIVDDGSTDDSLRRIHLLKANRLFIIRHNVNRGYGASLQSGFNWAKEKGYEQLVTMDCDWQHEPCLVPKFFSNLVDVDIVSGSRYMNHDQKECTAPKDRKAINLELTALINKDIGLNITDAFCGFKAYSKNAITKLSLKEDGYASPLELWVQIKALKLTLKEISVPLIYLDPKRSFGVILNDPAVRKAHYLDVLKRERLKWNV